MPLHLFSQDTLLKLIPMLKELLNNIVPEHVGHQLERIWLYFTENCLFLITICGLELLLNKSGAMLITAELDNMTVDILTTIRQCKQ